MGGATDERTSMAGKEEFLLALDDCEKTSAELLRALELGTPGPAALVARRKEQIERLSAILPAELQSGELERLKILCNVGQEAWLSTVAAKAAATRNLASLQRALHVARQLAATRSPRPSGVDCTG
jgi:hypothetical protein